MFVGVCACTYLRVRAWGIDGHQFSRPQSEMTTLLDVVPLLLPTYRRGGGVEKEKRGQTV